MMIDPSHSCCTTVAGSPRNFSLPVVPGHSAGRPPATSASNASSHSASDNPEGIFIESLTRNDERSAGATTSSAGTSAPGENCERRVHVPSYSVTSQPGGTSRRYPCREDSNVRGGLDETDEGEDGPTLGSTSEEHALTISPRTIGTSLWILVCASTVVSPRRRVAGSSALEREGAAR